MNLSTHRLPPTMDISALINNDGDAAVLPRRSLSVSHSVSAQSPHTMSAKLPTTPNAPRRQPSLKRKRNDPKPIWAYREGERLPDELQQLHEKGLQSRQPAPVHKQSTPQISHQPPPKATSHLHRPSAPPNGHHAPGDPAGGLVGYERPVSNDARVYDDVSRKVCDFIWVNAINNDLVRRAITDSEHTMLEVEARWGQIIDNSAKSRLRGYHDTETIVKSAQIDTKFESTMTVEQHMRMNQYLNGQLQAAAKSEGKRETINYKHTFEIDEFYELGQEQFATLPDTVKKIIADSGKRQRIRVTRDAKSPEKKVLRSIIKQRIANLEISSPQTEWDYRIGINLEITYPGPIDNLQPATDHGKPAEERTKDRISYSWLNAYQVDLTLVRQKTTKNHELELELDAKKLLENADKIQRKEPSDFEALINGMMNNLRVLSREITPPGAGA